PAESAATPGEAGAAKVPRAERKKEPQNRVWIASPAGPVAVPVTADATDGSWTRLAKGDLAERQEVIVGVVMEGSDSSTTNPFAPPFRGGGGGGGGGGQRGGMR